MNRLFASPIYNSRDFACNGLIRLIAVESGQARDRSEDNGFIRVPVDIQEVAVGDSYARSQSEKTVI